MKLLPIIILVIFCSVCNAQTAAEDYTKPAHRFSIGLVGGSVLADAQFYSMTWQHSYKEKHVSLGIVAQYHLTKHSTLHFQPNIYNLHADQYTYSGDKLTGKYNITTILLPVYFDLHNSNDLQFHFYTGIFYSNLVRYKGERYYTTGYGVDTTIYHNLLKENYTYGNGNLGISAGLGISYRYKHFQLGAQLLYMVGFSRANSFIRREQGYAPVSAVLAYSFN